MATQLSFADLSPYRARVEAAFRQPQGLDALIGAFQQGAQQGSDLANLPQDLQNQQLLKQITIAIQQAQLEKLQRPQVYQGSNSIFVEDRSTPGGFRIVQGPPKPATERASQFVGFDKNGNPIQFTPGEGLAQAPSSIDLSGPLAPKTEAPKSKGILALNKSTGRLTNMVLQQNEELPEGFSKYETPSTTRADPLKFTQDIAKDPVVKQHQELRTQFDRMRNAVEEAKTTNNLVAIDQTLINTFNRILDPQSVVRESEYARTAADQSVLNYLKGKFDLEKGGIFVGGAGLSSETRDAMIKMAERFYKASEGNYNAVVDQYSKIAQASGYDPELVLPRISLQTIPGASNNPVVSPVGTLGINPNAPPPVVPAGMRLFKSNLGNYKLVPK